MSEPPEEAIRRAAEPVPGARDTTPAVGRRGGPAGWRRAVEGGAVALARQAWADARWSYLYKDDTGYRAEAGEGVVEAARRVRGGDEVPVGVAGPFLNAPVWTWEVPAYFFCGGVAAGSSFVALAADLAGDERSAAIARKVTMGAIVPGAPLLVLDLGRPGRFLNMLRVFKPRSPMNLGSWCLAAFSAAGAGAVAADVAGRPRLAKALGAQTAVLGTYLGSYTGVLLAATAVPVWARSRALLPPLFVCTSVATGAAANRLVVADGPAREALRTLEIAAMGAELALSALNERRLGPLAGALDEGRAGPLFRAGKWAARLGLLLHRRRIASVLHLGAGLAFRFAWIEAGKASARDDEAVARTAREHRSRSAAPAAEPRAARHPPRAAPGAPLRAAYSDAIRRLSLAVERILHRG